MTDNGGGDASPTADAGPPEHMAEPQTAQPAGERPAEPTEPAPAEPTEPPAESEPTDGPPAEPTEPPAESEPTDGPPAEPTEPPAESEPTDGLPAEPVDPPAESEPTDGPPAEPTEPTTPPTDPPAAAEPTDGPPATGDQPADATVGGPQDAGEASVDQADPADEPAPREPDPIRDPLAVQISEALGDAILATVVERSDIWVRVSNAGWRSAVQWCKDHGFTYFCFLSGIDWLPSAELSGRYEQTFTPADANEAETTGAAEAAATALETGVAGGETRFQVFARLYDIDRKLGITLKADLDDAHPSVETVVPVFRGADWHEREAWEMYGFEFTGHPGLRHLYLPREFEGFPMRKDFPLLARVVKPWPGLVDKEPVPGEDEEEEEAAATT